MVADHQGLESQGLAGLVDDLNQLGHEVRTNPAILLIEDQETLVPLFVQGRQCKHPQSYGKDIGHRTALTLHDVFGFAIPFNPKLD